jgi:hypothetical protein
LGGFTKGGTVPKLYPDKGESRREPRRLFSSIKPSGFSDSFEDSASNLDMNDEGGKTIRLFHRESDGQQPPNRLFSQQGSSGRLGSAEHETHTSELPGSQVPEGLVRGGTMVRLFSNETDGRRSPRRLFATPDSPQTNTYGSVASDASVATADSGVAAGGGGAAVAGGAAGDACSTTADASSSATATANTVGSTDASASSSTRSSATTTAKPADDLATSELLSSAKPDVPGNTAVATATETIGTSTRPAPHKKASDSSNNLAEANTAQRQASGGRRRRRMNPLLCVAIIAFLVFSASSSLVVSGLRFEGGTLLAPPSVTGSQLLLVIGFLCFQLVSSTLLAYFIVRPTSASSAGTTFVSLLAQLLWFVSTLVTLPGLVNYLLFYRLTSSTWLMYAGIFLLVLAVVSIVASANTISSETTKLVINLCYLVAFIFATVCLFCVGTLVEHHGSATSLTFEDVSYLVSFDVDLPWLNVMVFKQLPTLDLLLASVTLFAGLFLGLQVTRRRQDSDPFFDGAFALAITCLVVAACHCLMVLTSNVIVCLILAITGICFTLYGLARKRAAVCIFSVSVAGLAIVLFIQVANNLTTLQQLLP